MPHKAPSVTLLKVLIFFLFATLIFSSRLYAKTQDTPTLPLTTSVFKLSDDGTIFDGGIVVPVKLDSTPSQLPYIPSKISLEALNHTNLSTNSFSVASANATFTINFLTSGTDATGQACSSNFPANARAVFTAAANIWGSIIQSSVPVTIDACWASFGGNTLGYAGARRSHRDFSNAPVANTWYPAALANSLAGFDLSPSTPDIVATFNSNFNWYYGTDGNTPRTQMDFLSVVLHEMGHGLGFSGSGNYSTTTGQGTWGSSGRQYIYDNFVKDSSGNKVTTYSSPSTSLGNFLTSNNVLFTGANAVAANSGNNIKLYAPSTWESGSSYSHLDYNTFNNTSNQLMVPSISPGEAVHDPGVVTKGLFKDVGWNLNGSSTATLGKASLLSPSGTITDTTPTYTWNAVSGSTWYYLYVNQGSSNKIKKWYTAAQAGCSSGSGTCSITPTTSLASGNHTWWIRTYNSSGNGPWSNGKAFTISSTTGGVPGKASLLSPSGTITDTTPTYTWNAVSGSTWYYLYVNQGSSNKIKKWYTASAAGCSSGSGTCSITPSTSLASGNHTWWIRTYNSSGNGPWSNGKAFTISSTTGGVPGKASLLSPSGTITDTTPTYTWNAVSGSTWYYLYVNQGSSNKIKKWYTASAAGCSSGSGTCSITPSTSLASGNHTWWIRTYNSSGNGPWSNGKIFNVSGSTTSGFNSQFNGDATDWYLVVASSPWTINSSNVSAQGTAGKVSSIFYQPNQYTNFEYSARIWRGSSSDNNESHATRLIIRGNPNNLDSTDGWDGYNFQITRSGFFSIWKHDNNGSTSPLQDWTSSTAIHQGSAWNTLTVWANASSLWFGINGVWVKNVTDSRFTNGNVGIGFYSGNGSDKLWVDWATLTPLGGSSQVAHSVSNRKISDKQLQLNDIANQNPIGDINGISAN